MTNRNYYILCNRIYLQQTTLTVNCECSYVQVWVKEDYGKDMEVVWAAGACKSTTGASVQFLNNEAGNICRHEIQQTQPGSLPSSADNNNTASSQTTLSH